MSELPSSRSPEEDLFCGLVLPLLLPALYPLAAEGQGAGKGKEALKDCCLRIDDPVPHNDWLCV